jgi:hypothetical protein
MTFFMFAAGTCRYGIPCVKKRVKLVVNQNGVYYPDGTVPIMRANELHLPGYYNTADYIIFQSIL